MVHADQISPSVIFRSFRTRKSLYDAPPHSPHEEQGASMSTTSSAHLSANRFGSRAAANKYALAHRDSATHRRECRCIRTALAGVPARGSLLDLPCGAGRFLPLLVGELCLKVTEADASQHMVAKAKQAADLAGYDDASFAVADALTTGFDDDQFDATLCNRLLHHFHERRVRTAALCELRRITRGPIVLSFFCNRAYDAATFWAKCALARKRPTDRIPIRLSTITSSCAEAGLVVTRVIPTRPGISMQWYLRVERI